jgi:hypothetical protein
MKKGMNSKSEHHKKVFQLKITLNDSTPKVWRRILVSADYSFFDLHCAIQDAMGWVDYHLHNFYIAQKGTLVPITIELPNPEIESYGDELDERKEKIADYFGVQVKQCRYCYDFGDSWDHTILLEKVIDMKDGDEYPKCIAGKNACPPEDCGGVGGYENLQQIMKDPKHEEYQEMLEWLCLEDSREFNPTEFDISDVVFENPKDILREYNKRFGLTAEEKSLMKDAEYEDKIVSPFYKKDLSFEIKRLKEKCLPKMGVWELCQRADPAFGNSNLPLNLIVHQDSYFIFAMRIISSDDTESMKAVFLEVVEKHNMVPNTLITDDLKIIEVFKDLSNAFGFEVKKDRIKAVPVILRDIKRYFNK